ncbi:MAG: hypothetical protein NVSMB12_05370 [Acidimicrobiales bacterium]
MKWAAALSTGWVATPEGQRWLLRGVGVLLVVGMASCLLIGASRPADPFVVPASARAGLTGHSAPTSRVAGFGHVGFRVVNAHGVGGLRCALLADTEPRRQRGLMGRSDLAGYDAMVFRFDADVTTAFYNKNVPMPLTVGWFDSAGGFVGSADMGVCVDPCPTVAPAVPYRYALEVRRGGLRGLGVSSGSVLLVGGSCT